jgi:hypothetical protein
VTGESIAEVAAIAAKLTKAQRAALLKCDTRWLNAAELSARGQTLRALCWLWPAGVSQISPPICLLSRDYQDSPLRYIYRLNDLGVAVKDHLISQGADHDR